MYAIDGPEPVQAVAPSVNGDTYDQLFWQSPTFSNGQQSAYSAIYSLYAVHS